ncbi:flocculation protein FLO11-like [Drosophila santomea]|uniref:flocculation protein FLO11-like n=1 Tax=Drosophila santomea TaxID=129105 RepID=UPI001952E7B2|nr:flocculation protein FLO11-like [Drosophila santomea]
MAHLITDNNSAPLVEDDRTENKGQGDEFDIVPKKSSHVSGSRKIIPRSPDESATTSRRPRSSIPYIRLHSFPRKYISPKKVDLQIRSAVKDNIKENVIVPSPDEKAIFESGTAPLPNGKTISEGATAPLNEKSLSESGTAPPPNEKSISESGTAPPPNKKTISESVTAPPPNGKTISDSITAPPPKKKTIFKSVTAPPPNGKTTKKKLKTKKNCITAPPPNKKTIFRSVTAPSSNNKTISKSSNAPPPNAKPISDSKEKFQKEVYVVDTVYFKGLALKKFRRIKRQKPKSRFFLMLDVGDRFVTRTSSSFLVTMGIFLMFLVIWALDFEEPIVRIKVAVGDHIQ